MLVNSTHRRGLTLLEIMLAIIVLTVVAVATMAYVRQPADRVKSQACNLNRAHLETIGRQYEADTARLPGSHMSQLTQQRYMGAPLPVCPIDGRPYVLDTRTGIVVPHGH